MNRLRVWVGLVLVSGIGLGCGAPVVVVRETPAADRPPATSLLSLESPTLHGLRAQILNIQTLLAMSQKALDEEESDFFLGLADTQDEEFLQKAGLDEEAPARLWLDTNSVTLQASLFNRELLAAAIEERIPIGAQLRRISGVDFFSWKMGRERPVTLAVAGSFLWVHLTRATPELNATPELQKLLPEDELDPRPNPSKVEREIEPEFSADWLFSRQGLRWSHTAAPTGQLDPKAVWSRFCPGGENPIISAGLKGYRQGDQITSALHLKLKASAVASLKQATQNEFLQPDGVGKDGVLDWQVNLARVLAWWKICHPIMGGDDASATENILGNIAQFHMQMAQDDQRLSLGSVAPSEQNPSIGPWQGFIEMIRRPGAHVSMQIKWNNTSSLFDLLPASMKSFLGQRERRGAYWLYRVAVSGLFGLPSFWIAQNDRWWLLGTDDVPKTLLAKPKVAPWLIRLRVAQSILNSQDLHSFFAQAHLNGQTLVLTVRSQTRD